MSEIISLSQKERDRFALWLEQEANSDKLILSQMEKISVANPLVKQKKIHVLSYLTVAKILRSIEDWGIQG